MNTSSQINTEKIRTPLIEFWYKFKKQKLALGAGGFIFILIILAIFSPWITPYDPIYFFDYEKINEGPSLLHWFGVDSLGRDIFSRILMGTRISLASGFFSVVIGMLIGIPIGLLAGYYGGFFDHIAMRFCDVLFAFPGMLLAIGIVAILGNGLFNVIIAVAIFSIPAFARLVRGSTLSIKNLTYIEAEKSMGAPDIFILFKHILPGTFSSILVYFSLRIGTSIITAASLSFIGLGAQPPTPEWGAMLNEARADMMIAPHIAFFPCIVIFLTVLAFNLLGDGLRDALDPKLND